MGFLPSNPNFAFVSFKVGNLELTPIPPSHLESFSYEKVSKEGKANIFRLTVHDSTSTAIESELANGSRECEFYYGYTNGNQTDVLKGTITKYDPDFTGVGVSLSLEGVGGELASAIADPKSITYKKMLISDIVKAEADANGWYYTEDTIEETAPVMESKEYSITTTLGSTASGSSSGGASGSGDFSQMDPKVQEVMNALTGKGLNVAAACGVCGNMFYESTFNPAAVGDHGTSFGLCQWHNARGTAMKSAVPNWETNVSGQIDFLWNELNSSYQSTLEALKSASNTEAGAKQAADAFVRKFEQPGDIDNQSAKRQAKAAEYWNQVQFSSGGGNGGSLNDGSLSQRQQAVVNACSTTPTRSAGWCAGWVCDVFDKSGVGAPRLNAARDYFQSYCSFSDKSQLKPGMILACHPSGSSGSEYGHIGIYVGNDKVMHSIGYVATHSVDGWINEWGPNGPKKGGPVKWGWMGGVDLST